MGTPSPAKGIVCPACGSAKFDRVHVHRPAPGRVVRYKRCANAACHRRVKTVERIASDHRPKGHFPAEPGPPADT